MNKEKGMRLLATLTLCVVLLCAFSTTTFAYADDTDQDLPVTEATQPEDMPDAENEPEVLPTGEPIDGEGNAYTRDLLYGKETNKQFITIQTKNGNTFYIIIDYDAPINDEEEQYHTYFLNMVDESDLLALMDEEAVSALTTCTCEKHCEAGSVNTACPVCKTNMSECTGTTPEPETPPEGEDTEAPDTEEPESGGNLGMIIAIVAIVGVGGAAYYYFKFVRGKKKKDEDLDFFDDEGYEEEPYINEDDEPLIEDDEDTDEDEK